MIYLLPIVMVLFVWYYHWVRNGLIFSLPSFVSRLLWAVTVVVGYFMLGGTSFVDASIMLLGVLITNYIPHGFAMTVGQRVMDWRNMPRIPFIGSWTLPKAWPAIWLLPLMSGLNYTEQDLVGMTIVGLMRGILSFAFTGDFAACAIITAGHTLSYYAGNKFPLSVKGVDAKTAGWGEVFVAVLWAIAVACAV